MATKSSDNMLLVAAIDFGTTYSGYAFSFRNKPMDLQTPQTWYAGSTQLASMKTPTCLLIQPKKEPLFGYEAENTYTELTANEDYQECHFFQHFKMLLHGNKNLTRSTIVEDISGKSMQALKVFSLSINFFIKHLLKTLDEQSTGIHLCEMHFVITVPAIWNDSAKQFMREAAVDAGLDNEKVSIALEPEAASIHCQQLPTEKFTSSCDFKVAKPGTEYMVVDLGGGTVDTTVHRKEVDGSLSSLHAASGGPWGGQMVNNEYINFFTDVVGVYVMQKFRKEEAVDYFDFLRDFEYKKRTISPDKEGSLIIRIPVSFKETYEKHTKRSFQEAVQSSKYSQHISFMSDKLKVNMHFMSQMFKTSIGAIINHVSNLLEEPLMQNVDRVLLVGGYSECPLVRKAFRDKFGEKRIINPHQAGLAVIKGAVHFGHNPSIILSRILSYTYGISSSPRFKEGIHSEEMKFTDSEGTCRCKNFFFVFKHAGDMVRLGERVSSTRTPLTKSQTEINYRVFVTSNPDPKYVTDEGCIELGSFDIDLTPYDRKRRRIILEFVFGSTEFMVEATDDKSKNKIRKYIDLPE